MGRVRVRPEGHPLGPHRPQAQVLRHRLPARPGPGDEREDPPPVLHRAAADHRGRRRLPSRHRSRGAGSRAPARALQPGRPPPLQRLRRADPGRDGDRASRRRRQHRGRGRPAGTRAGLPDRRRGRRGYRRGAARGERADPRGSRRAPRRPQSQRTRGVLPRLGAVRRDDLEHPGQGHDEGHEGGADRDLPPDAPRRPADARERAVAVLRDVLRRQALRLLPGGPVQVQHQAREGRAGRPEDPLRRGLLPGDRVPPAAPEGRGARRRHRQPGQPPGARRRRAAGEPVPGRPGADGAGDQGEDVRAPGHRLGDAARPDQLEAGHRGDQGVLRFVPALAVHGPDESAVRGHPTSGGCRRSALAACRGSARASRSATSTPRTTAASARSRRPRGRTSASSPRWRPTPRSTTTGSSRVPTRRSKVAASSITSR